MSGEEIAAGLKGPAGAPDGSQGIHAPVSDLKRKPGNVISFPLPNLHLLA